MHRQIVLLRLHSLTQLLLLDPHPEILVPLLSAGFSFDKSYHENASRLQLPAFPSSQW